jgi:YegS/Rv2252/BmrU family lipid kinase
LKRALLIVNPAAGRRHGPRVASDVARSLEGAGYAVETAGTTAAGEATPLARAAAAGGAAAVFALGGDGTLREVAQGLLGSRTALGVLPAGTTNVVALALGLPREPRAAALAVVNCVEREMDVGIAGDRVFLMQATAGFDGYLMGCLDARLKGRWGKAAVVAQACAAFARYGFPEIEIEADGERHRATHVAVCNLAHYAGRFRLAPGARWDDRRLDLRLFAGRGHGAALATTLRLLLDRAEPRAKTLPIDRVMVLGPADAALQIDGDPLRLALPVAIALAPERLVVLAPARGAA